MGYLEEVLNKRFGFQAFRPHQKEAIEALLEKKRLLSILPTGYGKSLLYQLPAVLFEHMTLVISPLLALMRDQLEHLEKRFGISCGAINSDQTEEENEAVRNRALHGQIKILFVAPEQLDHVERFSFLQNLNIDLVVVDEAHCISTWGHDFRPSYRQIVSFIQALEKKRLIHVLALTATANRKTEADIQAQLGNVDVIRQSLDRPNVALSVRRVEGMSQKLALLHTLVSEMQGNGLIYCATREHVELVSEYLECQGIDAKAYHAGFAADDKRKLQAAFIQDRHKLLVATNALGMGIDKANIRFIIHFDIPGSITAYYQEVGRAGRDGLDATGILLFDPQDRRIQDYFINSAQPKKDDFEKVLKVVEEALDPPGLLTIKCQSGLHPTLCTVVVAELVEQEFLEKEMHLKKQVYKICNNKTSFDLERYERQFTVKTSELDAMMRYAAEGLCRMQTLRKALGDVEVAACGRCDICCSTYNAHSEISTASFVEKWLSDRYVPLAPQSTYGIQEGIALLDSQIRSPLFIEFMRNRKESITLNDQLLEKAASAIEKWQPAAIIPIPSKTWAAQMAFLEALSKRLNIELLPLLYWKKVPEARQGELLNNDQRRQNISNTMGIAMKPPENLQGSYVLFDDYTGSGATLKEAARALRKEGKITNAIFPFTLASVRWRLGSPGMV